MIVFDWLVFRSWLIEVVDAIDCLHALSRGRTEYFYQFLSEFVKMKALICLFFRNVLGEGNFG